VGVTHHTCAALHLAATQGHSHMVRCLLRSGLDANSPNHDRYTPFHHAALTGNMEVIEVLGVVEVVTGVGGRGGQSWQELMAAGRTICV